MLDGQKWIPFGGSIYDMSGGNANYDAKQALTLSMNMNTMRFIHYKNMNPAVGNEFNETDWSRVDYDLDQARQAGLKVHLDLANILGLFGNRGYSAASPTQGLFDSYQTIITWLAARINTINGLTYAADDIICMIAICGEISGFGVAECQAFYGGIGDMLQVAFPNHLITSGGQVLSIMPTVAALPSIDCISLHDYDTDASQETDFPAMRAIAVANNKPWFLEEFGMSQSSTNDGPRAEYYRRVYTRALKYGCAAFILWNIDSGVGAGLGVNPNTKQTFKVVRMFSKYTGYSPRIPVSAVDFANYP